MNTIHQKRIAKVRRKMTDKNLDAVMISVQENRYYLSGFTGEDDQFDESAGVLFISHAQLLLATDGHHEKQARDEADDFEIFCYKEGLEKALAEIASHLRVRHIGFESVRISYKKHDAMEKALNVLDPPATLVPTENIVESLRRIKNEEEIQHTVDAIRLAEGAFCRLLTMLHPGMTEKEAAWEIEKDMREAGAQTLAFPVIVASGPNSALPRFAPTDRSLKQDEPILINWGARLNGYCSDTARTIVIGAPCDQFKKVYDTVAKAGKMAIDAIRAGVGGSQVDKVARDYIVKNGFGEHCSHNLGHGTGLAAHEYPCLNPIKDDQLEAGMIVTVAPGIYLPGWGGVRMENQAVVRSSGAQTLNNCTPFDPVAPI